MKNRLTHLLFAVLLLCAQALATAHAVEHTMEGDKALPAHVCLLCVASHDLGSGLTGNIVTPPVVKAAFTPHHFTCHARAALPAPDARQQSPPAA